uniref:Glucagon a n=2 Tax=Cyprinus carpio TaxID=7962 RepID=A0A8C1GVK4_CYPCA
MFGWFQKWFFSHFYRTCVFRALKMKGIQYLAGLLLLLFVQDSICVPLQDDNASTETVEGLLARGQGFTTAKRHSEGTFSNDYSKYLETRRAQDFVQWLMNSKRNGYVRLQCEVMHRIVKILLKLSNIWCKRKN